MAWPYGSAAPTWIDTFTNAAPPYAFGSVASGSPSLVAATVNATIDDVTAVAFSSSFPSDATMLITTVTDGGAWAGSNYVGKIALHAASFNLGKWDKQRRYKFPEIYSYLR